MSDSSHLQLYKKLRKIGKGTYSTVWLAQHTQSLRHFAVKEVQTRNLDQKELTNQINEVDVLRKLSHPNIVKYHEDFVDKPSGNLCIVMEHCEGGDLQSLIKRNKAKGLRFSEQTVVGYFYQLVLGLRELHAQRIIHRDLKTANILLTGGDRVLKIADFNICKQIK